MAKSINFPGLLKISLTMPIYHSDNQTQFELVWSNLLDEREAMLDENFDAELTNHHQYDDWSYPYVLTQKRGNVMHIYGWSKKRDSWRRMITCEDCGAIYDEPLERDGDETCPNDECRVNNLGMFDHPAYMFTEERL